MEKQDLPKEEQNLIAGNKIFRLAKLIFGSLTYAGFYSIIFLSFITNIYYWATLEGMSTIAILFLKILRLFIFFYLCYGLILIIKAGYNHNLKRRLMFQERRIKFKKELKSEILREMKNGRNTKAR